MKSKIYWGSYSTKELADFVQQDPVVILPVGAYEQHGPHLPLDTDTHIGLELAKAAVKNADVPCALLPPVWLGISEHHMSFAGSLTLRQSTLTAVIYDVLKSLARHGVKKILVLNSHGGNMAPLRSAVDQVGGELSVEPALVTYWHLVGDVVQKLRRSEFGGISHGGELETALKLYLAPEDVRHDLLQANMAPGNNYWSPEMFAANKVAIYKPYNRLSRLGHVGDPTKATAEFGKAVFEAAVGELVKVIRLLQKGELSR